MVVMVHPNSRPDPKAISLCQMFELSLISYSKYRLNKCAMQYPSNMVRLLIDVFGN